MLAIQTIIETYLRFSDERALLALKAHRLKLLAETDERDPFSRSLRSQCAEEISAIEAGLATFQRAAPTVEGIDSGIEIANGGSEPPGADEASWTGAANGSAGSEARPAVDRLSEEVGPSSFDPAPKANESPAAMEPAFSDSLPSLQNPFCPPSRSAQQLLPAGSDRTLAVASPAPATADPAQRSRGMEELPLLFSRMPASGALIASWPLQLQDEPYLIEAETTSSRLRAGVSANADGTLSGGCLFAGMHCLANIRFGQG
jgi:hypothetical protein